MVCSRCQSHFCYLCSSWLDSSNPYKHYNTPESSCYLRLWELEEGDGVDLPPRQAWHEEPLILGHGAVDSDDDEDDDEDMVNMGPVQAGGGRQNQPAGPRAPRGAHAGLQRFVRLVNEDAEDEWDSDELDDEEGANGNWEIPVR